MPEEQKSTPPTVGDTPTVAWYQNPQILVGVSGFAAATYMILKGFGVHVPFSSENFSLIVTGTVSASGCGYFIYRRIKAGLDPANPTPRVTLRNEVGK